MARTTNKKSGDGAGGATVGYEAQLWQMADALRGSMDAAEYKHVCLGLLFLKYISDAFEEKHAALLAEKAQGADPEDPDEYRAQSIFWVPPEARWPHLKAQARQSTIGQLVDDAMAGIERDNPALKGVLPKDYARPALDKLRLGQLIDMISNIKVGDEASRAKDVLGRVYEYFLSQFASAEGKKGGEFYTPRCVVKLLVEMLEPYRGRVYDPCCGSSGMFVQSVEFIRAHAKGNGNGGKAKADISIYGQESNYTTWRLARMNLAIRGIDRPDRAGRHLPQRPPPRPQGRLHPRQPALQHLRLGRRAPARRQALAVRRAAGGQRQLRLGAAHRPPPRARGRGRLRARQRLDVVQPVRRGRDPQEPDRGRPRGLHGRAAGPALLLDADPRVPVVPCARPQGRRCEARLPRPARHALFIDARELGTRMTASRELTDVPRPKRRRLPRIALSVAQLSTPLDARKLGRMVDRTHRELTDEDIARIADTYHAWRGEKEAGEYADVPGFCKSAPLDEVRKHGHVLTPGRYVGAEAQEDDGEPFEEKMQRLTATLREQQAEAAKLDAAIAANLKELGYGG